MLLFKSKSFGVAFIEGDGLYKLKAFAQVGWLVGLGLTVL